MGAELKVDLILRLQALKMQTRSLVHTCQAVEVSQEPTIKEDRTLISNLCLADS